jgi:hypothetical protein
LSSLSSLKISAAEKTTIAQKAEKAAGAEDKTESQTDGSTGVNLSKETSTTAANLTKETNQNNNKSKGALEEWLSALLKLNYTQHVFLIMILVGSEDTYLNRLADLVQMEGSYRATTSGAKLSQQTLGTYDTFDVEKAYTTIRMEATGVLKQMLPVPALDGTDTDLFASPFSYHRVLYRGY